MVVVETVCDFSPALSGRGWPEHVSQRNRPLTSHLLSRYERDRELDYLFIFNSLKSGHMVEPSLRRRVRGSGRLPRFVSREPLV